MARLKSDDKRSAILAAAIRVIGRQGLGAPTALIAKEAGIANGSLFTYFKTKAALLNQLYLEIKTEMGSAALEGLPPEADLREQFLHGWANWMRWTVRHPQHRRVLAQLNACADITEATRASGHQAMARLAALMELARAGGSMREAPFPFVVALMNSVAETTMDFMVHDPGNAEQHSKAGFDALWRMLS